MNIRSAASYDADAIRKIHLAAFGEDEAEIVSQLAVDLLSQETTPPTLSLLAEINDSVIGHVAFSPVTIDDNKSFLGYILGPLAVLPEYQGQGAGSELVKQGIEQLSATETHIIFVYGDPQYYSRFGFDTETAEQFITPYELEYSFGWQARLLNEYDIGETPVKVSCVPALAKPELW